MLIWLIKQDILKRHTGHVDAYDCLNRKHLETVDDQEKMIFDKCVINICIQSLQRV